MQTATLRIREKFMRPHIVRPSRIRMHTILIHMLTICQNNLTGLRAVHTNHRTNTHEKGFYLFINNI